jgi:hypothetical protein
VPLGASFPSERYERIYKNPIYHVSLLNADPVEVL